MTVSEFVNGEIGSKIIYNLIDSTKSGYLLRPERCLIASNYRGVISSDYGNSEVVGFEIKNKTNIFLYVKLDK